jgi:hypothetical protein
MLPDKLQYRWHPYNDHRENGKKDKLGREHDASPPGKLPD